VEVVENKGHKADMVQNVAVTVENRYQKVVVVVENMTYNVVVVENMVHNVKSI